MNLKRIIFVVVLISIFIFADEAQAFKFAVYGDNRSYPSVHEKIIAALMNKMPNGERVTILNSGDICYSGKLDEWKTDFGYFNGTSWSGPVTPLEIDYNKTNPPDYIVSPGNHEANENTWPQNFAQFLPTQRGLSVYADEGVLGQIDGLWGSFKYENTLFIWLDSNNPPDLSRYPDVDYDKYPQLLFIDRTLIEADEDEEVVWKFVFFHHPPVPCGAKSEILNLKKLNDYYFIPHSVDVVFLGHAHYYERTCPFTSANNKNCDENNRGTMGVELNNPAGPVHIITGGGGAGLYSPSQCDWLEVGESVHHFLEVDIQGSRINIKAWDVDNGTVTNPTLIDELTIQKNGGQSSPSPSPEISPSPSPTSIPKCFGNTNTTIDTDDVLTFLVNYLTNNTNIDINSDSKINIFEFAYLVKNWGKSCSN